VGRFQGAARGARTLGCEPWSLDGTPKRRSVHHIARILSNVQTTCQIYGLRKAIASAQAWLAFTFEPPKLWPRMSPNHSHCTQCIHSLMQLAKDCWHWYICIPYSNADRTHPALPQCTAVSLQVPADVHPPPCTTCKNIGKLLYHSVNDFCLLVGRCTAICRPPRLTYPLSHSFP
jgi:hypothetical protein